MISERRGSLTRVSVQKKHGKRATALKIGLVALILASVTAILAGVFLARQVSTVRNELVQGMGLVTDLKSNLSSGDEETAKLLFRDLQTHIAAARSHTDGPLWTMASLLPLIGPNFHAVREGAVTADDVATALGPLLDEYESLDWKALSPVNGRIDVTALAKAEPAITSAASTVRMSYDRLAGLDHEPLVLEVSEPLGRLSGELGDVTESLQVAATAAQLLPAMLGRDGQRNYLLLIQNNAEMRATGGIPGALAVLRTDNGRIDLAEQSTAGALGEFTPELPVGKEQEDLFSSRIGRYMQSVNLTPDFPTAASTAKRMWEERHPGQSIEGVIALDPVVLAHLLEATGPIELIDPVVLDLVSGTDLPTSLTSENVVPTLLSNVYGEIEDPALQDVYFAAVASEIFGAFTNGQGDPSRLLNALGLSAEEQRLYLWSARESEQKVISQTALAGAVTGSRVGGAAFGMYFNDGTGAKMDYYAKRTVQLIQGCRAEGYGEYTLRVSVTNNAPPDAHDSLPPYVTGGGAFEVEPGHIRTNYVAYGPAQSLVQAARLNGRLIPFASGLHGQRPVGTVSIELAPGESAELEFTFFKVVQDAEPKLSVTPTVDPVSEVVLPLRKEPDCA